MTDEATFLKGFLKSPREVGSVIPSSKFLEARIRRVIDAAHARTAVELGPGTGGTTRAVLRDMPAHGRLLAIDTNPIFIRKLKRIDDPRLIAQKGNAQSLAAIMRGYDLPAPEVIFSGIPFSTMPTASALDILSSVWRALAPGGRFLAYQFRGDVGRLGREVMGTPVIEREWLNIPPMVFYAWDKPVAVGESELNSGSLAGDCVPAAELPGSRAQ